MSLYILEVFIVKKNLMINISIMETEVRLIGSEVKIFVASLKVQ